MSVGGRSFGQERWGQGPSFCVVLGLSAHEAIDQKRRQGGVIPSVLVCVEKFLLSVSVFARGEGVSTNTLKGEADDLPTTD